MDTKKTTETHETTEETIKPGVPTKETRTDTRTTETGPAQDAPGDDE